MKAQVGTGENIDLAIDYLRQGKAIIYPTDTVYGLGVDAHNPKAVENLLRLKQRLPSKPMPVFLPNKESVYLYAKNIPALACELMNQFWPGPITLVLEAQDFPSGISHDGKVGFRVSSHPWILKLLKKFGRCITSTSANISGQETPSNLSDFFQIFSQYPVLLIEDDGHQKSALASTVVQFQSNSYEVLREGVITKSQIEKIHQDLKSKEITS